VNSCFVRVRVLKTQSTAEFVVVVGVGGVIVMLYLVLSRCGNYLSVQRWKRGCVYVLNSCVEFVGCLAGGGLFLWVCVVVLVYILWVKKI